MIDLIITSIVVDLSDQKLYAYNGPQLVRTIPVSSGTVSYTHLTLPTIYSV